MLTLLDAVVSAAAQVVTTLGNVVTPAGAIVLLTVAVRGMLLPLGIRAAKANRARIAIRPLELQLRKQYVNNSGRLTRELAALRQKHGISQFAGIAPMLAQLPFFVVLYRLFASATIGGHTNLLLTQAFLGVPLSSHLTLLVPDVLVYLGLFAILCVIAWWTARQTRTVMAVSGPEVPRAFTSISGILPYGIIVAAAVAPLAAAVYLLTSTAWTAAQRHILGA